MDNYKLAIEELALSGSIAIRGSTSTVYRWARAINEILEREQYDWRVRADAKEGALYAISKEEK